MDRLHAAVEQVLIEVLGLGEWREQHQKVQQDSTPEQEPDGSARPPAPGEERQRPGDAQQDSGRGEEGGPSRRDRIDSYAVRCHPTL